MRRLLLLAMLALASPGLAETIVVRPDLTFQGSKPYRDAVEAHVGDTLRIDLPSRAGTGYSWAATLEGDALRPGRSETHAATRPGGTQRMIQTFSAATAGTARITFVYTRPWETGQEPAGTATFDVTVRAAPAAPPPAAAP